MMMMEGMMQETLEYIVVEDDLHLRAKIYRYIA